MRLFGSTAVFSAQYTPDAVTESGAFIGPLTCGSVPAKSTISRSAVLLHREANAESRIRAEGVISNAIAIAEIFESAFAVRQIASALARMSRSE